MFRAIPSHLETLLLHLTLGWMKLTRQETAASQMLFPALYGKISPRIIWVSLQGMVLWTHCLTSMGHGTTHYKIRTPCVTICEAAVDMPYDGHWRWEPCEDLIVLYLGPFKYSQSGLHWLEPLESHICWLGNPIYLWWCVCHLWVGCHQRCVFVQSSWEIELQNCGQNVHGTSPF